MSKPRESGFAHVSLAGVVTNKAFTVADKHTDVQIKVDEYAKASRCETTYHTLRFMRKVPKALKPGRTICVHGKWAQDVNETPNGKKWRSNHVVVHTFHIFVQKKVWEVTESRLFGDSEFFEPDEVEDNGVLFDD